MKNKNGKILLALLVGAAIGTGMGILYAPKKGKDTRKKIKHTITDATHEVSEWAKHAKNDLSEMANAKREPVDKKLDGVSSAISRKAENVYKS